ncbi:hypothetical protein JOF53_005653 [Crossiella equi]|uniref:Secreted protein n=1 Tax=Crossiella equi TaxID=130796 RepID=A0ABS5AK43_9PSEU|nr:hypothetical protein [Crossiella equi]MBP2476781.1 hypothetical protein [Crossiella equi]
MGVVAKTVCSLSAAALVFVSGGVANASTESDWIRSSTSYWPLQSCWAAGTLQSLINGWSEWECRADGERWRLWHKE